MGKNDLSGGSGSRKFRRGRRITSLNGIRKGMFIIADSSQFGATNVARITDVDRTQTPGFNAIFVDPNKPSQIRLGSDSEFFVHEFELKGKNRPEVYYVGKK